MQQGWRAPALDLRLLVPIGLTLVQLTLVTAVALLFSTFSSPLLAVLLTLGVWVAGQFSADLRSFETAVDAPVAAAIARAVYYVLPNLSALDVKNQVVHGLAIAWPAVGAALAAAGVYVALVLTVAMRGLLPAGLQVSATSLAAASAARGRPGWRSVCCSPP